MKITNLKSNQIIFKTKLIELKINFRTTIKLNKYEVIPNRVLPILTRTKAIKDNLINYSKI